MKPGITIRSDGDNGLERTKATILDGGRESGDQPGVMMAEGSTLDGFTVTHVGVYDDTRWKQHFDSKGDELGDAEGSVQAEGTRPAISIQAVSCTVTHCMVHHNGDVGIGVLGRAGTTTAPHITDNLVFRNMGGGIGVADGAEPIIRNNTCKENLRAGIGCRNANPIIINNLSFQNIRAGIGCREGSQPLIRGNKCFQNRRAGIGIRMKDTAPVVENNECHENEMAGIGCRDGARPILRYNICSKNKMAGIGCRDGAAPLIVGNECRQNELAGIGVQHQASAILHANTCVDNKLVAVGVTAESSATITGNDFSRVGGLPPIIAVKEGSTATIGHNRITGGGVAAILVQGRATITGNTFIGIGAAQGNAVWVWANSTAAISENSFDGYRTAVHATKATVTITGNHVSRFQGAAFVAKESPASAHVYGNTAISDDPDANLIDLQGGSGTVEQNVLKQ